VTSQGSVDRFLQRVKSTYGTIDLLFLNAGE
jgi:NADP-dependent 3-hydroxy acid dehydrogenase YdfG